MSLNQFRPCFLIERRREQPFSDKVDNPLQYLCPLFESDRNHGLEGYRSRGIAHNNEGSPEKWRLIPVLRHVIKLRVAQCRRFVFLLREMDIEPLHQELRS